MRCLIMDKYKINFIFNNEKDINDILINILNKETKKYIQMICKNNLREIISSHNPVKGEKNC